MLFDVLLLRNLKNGGKAPLSYQSFIKLAGNPPWTELPLSTGPNSIPPVGDLASCEICDVPSLQELGYDDIQQVSDIWLSSDSFFPFIERKLYIECDLRKKDFLSKAVRLWP